MIDKDSRWALDNGLSTVVTTLLQMNMNGYPFVLPDMIGGNGYNGRPSKELFIRWLQANVFMPSLQYSYVPWDYDQEVDIFKFCFILLKKLVVFKKKTSKLLSLNRYVTHTGLSSHYVTFPMQMSLFQSGDIPDGN